ncbi:MAG: GNAT family N-acetyltransferase [Alphaproteobacteria bacterium]
MPSDLELKAAGVVDAGLIARLHRLCFADAWSVDSVRDLLASPGVFARVAWRGQADEEQAGGQKAGGQKDSDRTPVGFVIHRIVSGESELMALGVAPDQRGRGLGLLLLELALAEVGQAGVRAMFLEVAVDNPAAQSLYLKQGFKQVGRRSAYYRLPDGRQVDALVFRRLLPSPVGGRA